MKKIKYSIGAYNKFNETDQYIRISEGCPNNCKFCYETKFNGVKPKYYKIPKIVRNNVKIMDMNLIYKPKALDIIKYLGSLKVNNKAVYYELICGIDYRFLNLELALALKKSRFKNIRFAWDHSLKDQYKIKDTIDLLKKVGFQTKLISCFVICDYEISFNDCLKKLDLLKIWNVKINDCWFNNAVSPNFQLNYWTIEQCKTFRRLCRKHNQLILFGIDPELKQI